MNYKHYPIDPELSSISNIQSPIYRIILPTANAYLAKHMISSDKELTVIKKAITSFDHEQFHVLLLEPTNIPKDAPCLVYFHGGAFVMKAAPYHYELARRYALNLQCKVIFVDYRLAPSHPFPIPVQDAFFAYKWTVEHAKDLGISKNKIAVGGDSAGGNLAVVCSLMARDQKFPLPCFQMLVYPVTDRRMLTDSMKKYTDTPMWNARLNRKMWKWYLSPDAAYSNSIAYASPAEAENLEGLPPTYLEVEQFDCLHDEGTQFAQMLLKAGCPVQFEEIKGTFHGFDILINTKKVKNVLELRYKALQKAFQ